MAEDQLLGSAYLEIKILDKELTAGLQLSKKKIEDFTKNAQQEFDKLQAKADATFASLSKQNQVSGLSNLEKSIQKVNNQYDEMKRKILETYQAQSQLNAQYGSKSMGQAGLSFVKGNEQVEIARKNAINQLAPFSTGEGQSSDLKQMTQRYKAESDERIRAVKQADDEFNSYLSGQAQLAKRRAALVAQEQKAFNKNLNQQYAEETREKTKIARQESNEFNKNLDAEYKRSNVKQMLMAKEQKAFNSYLDKEYKSQGLSAKRDESEWNKAFSGIQKKDNLSFNKQIKDNIDKATESAGFFDGALQRVGRTLAAFGAIMAITALASAFKELISIGLDFNKTMETANLGIASILSTQNDFYSSSGGKLQGIEKMNAAMKVSSKVMEQLKIDNFSTTATLEQLTKAFQHAIAPASAVGFSIEQTRKYTIGMVQAAGAMGLNLDMMAEEMRSLVKGTITPKNTIIATNLGITNDDIRKYKGDSEGLFNFIMEKLKEFSIAGKLSQKTFEGLKSNVKDAFSLAWGKSSEGMFNTLKVIMKDTIDYLIVFNKETKKMEVNKEFVSAWTNIFNIFESLSRKAAALVKSMNEFLVLSDKAETFTLQQENKVKTFFKEAVDNRFTRLFGMAEYLKEVYELEGRSEFKKTEVENTIPDKNYQSLYYKETGIDVKNLSYSFNELNGQLELTDKFSNLTASGFNSISMVAKDTKMDIDEIKHSVTNLINEFKSLDNSRQSFGESLDEEIASTKAKIKAMDMGRDLSLLPIEGKLAKRLQDIEQEAKKRMALGEPSLEVEEVSQIQRQKARDAYSLAIQERERENKIRDANKRGSASHQPKDYASIDQTINKLELKFKDFEKSFADLNFEIAEGMAKAAGDGTAAANIEIEKWIYDKKYQFDKRIEQMKNEISQMENDFAKAKYGVTQEARDKLKGAKEKVTEFEGMRPQIYGSIEQEAGQKKTINAYKDAEEIMQLNLQYANLNGTVEQQLLLQKELNQVKYENYKVDKLTYSPERLAAIKKMTDEEERRAAIQKGDSFGAGFQLAFEDYKRNMPKLGEMGYEAFSKITEGINSAADALTEFTMTGKMDFGNMVESMIKGLIRLQYQQMLNNMIMGGEGGKGILGWVSGLLGFGSSVPSSAPSAPWTTKSIYEHSGGIVGQGTVSRFTPSSIFNNAPRLHGGLSADEFPAILQKGETVIPKGQGAAPSVTVNVLNQTKAPVKAEQKGAMRFDQAAKKFVLDVVLTASAQDENFRNGLSSVLPR